MILDCVSVETYTCVLLQTQISELEEENEDVKKQLNEQRATCDVIEKRETERRQLEEKKHTEEIQALKKSSQQLKVMLQITAKRQINTFSSISNRVVCLKCLLVQAQLEGIITPKK